MEKAYFVLFRVLCETIKDFVAKVGKAHDEKSHEDDMSAKVRRWRRDVYLLIV